MNFVAPAWIRRVIRRAGALLALGLNSAGCGAAEDGFTIGVQEVALRGGQPTTPDLAAVVQFQAVGVCTGTLVAPNLVLTVAHCLAEHEGNPRCARFGELVEDGLGSGSLRSPVAAETIRIFASGASERSLAFGKAVYHPPLHQVGCVNDLAFIELDRRLDIPPLPIDLQVSIEPGHLVRLVGHGGRNIRSLRAVENEAVARVIAVGTSQGQTTQDTTFPGTLLLEAGLCDGDSGGPVIAPELGRVVGVLSKREGTDCLDPANRAVATHLRDHAELVARALSAANPRTREPAASASGTNSGCTLAAWRRQGIRGTWLMLVAVCLCISSRRRR
jgi:hypothetical protein